MTLSPEQREALYLTHLQYCRQQDSVLAQALEVARAVRKTRNQVRNLAKRDGFPLKIIDEVLQAEARSRGDLQAEQDLRRCMWEWAGLPVGGQADLFLNMPVEIKDAADWKADGYRAGIQGRVGTPPENVPPRFLQDWLQGWGDGQERIAWSMSERGKIVDRRTDIAAQRVELEPLEEADHEPNADPVAA